MRLRLVFSDIFDQIVSKKERAGVTFEPDWLEYDWVGDNVYFAGWASTIGVCNRVKLECDVVINGRLSPEFYGGEKFALEPTKG